MKKVGIIVDSGTASDFVADFIRQSRFSSNYYVSTIIVNETDETRFKKLRKAIFLFKRDGFYALFSIITFNIITYLEQQILLMFVKKNKPPRKSDYNFGSDIEIISLNPIFSPGRMVIKYRKEDIDKLKKLNFSIFIRACSGILQGDILDICPNGVISYHHDDNKMIRGGPPGFWEVYERKATTGFIIQLLKSELDGGDVLFRGSIPTSWLYTTNRDNIFQIASPYLDFVVNDLCSDNPTLGIEEKVPYDSKLYRAPTLLQTINYCLKSSFHGWKKVTRSIFNKSYRWGVAYQFTADWRDSVIWRSIKLPNPKRRFLADPFIIYRNGSHFCFVEDYCFETKKGSISAYEINSDGHKRFDYVLKEEFHLSYPFIFECENQTFMCPETSEKNEIRLYKCLEFPNRWEYFKTLIRDISAVDTNIFFMNGYWWLFTNIDSSGSGIHSCELHIFFSDDPLSDRWVPHACNPVIFDSLSARNGGLIIDSTGVFRVFQKQGFDQYGEKLGVSEILELSPVRYQEKVLFEIKPKFFNHLFGTHTYNYAHGLMAIDFLTIENSSR